MLKKRVKLFKSRSNSVFLLGANQSHTTAFCLRRLEKGEETLKSQLLNKQTREKTRYIEKYFLFMKF